MTHKMDKNDLPFIGPLPRPVNRAALNLPPPQINSTPREDDTSKDLPDKFNQPDNIDQLRKGLDALPKAVNNFMIIIPENDKQEPSQVVQRSLPRPSEISCCTTLHSAIAPLTELEMADELIKKEMNILLCHDAIVCPSDGQKSHAAQAAFSAYLEENPYIEVDPSDMKKAKDLLHQEMKVVKNTSGNSSISEDTFAQVWETCYNEKQFLCGQNITSLPTDKERINILKKEFEITKGRVIKSTEKADNLEKQLEISLGGYQTRSDVLIKQLQKLTEEIDVTSMELATFQRLRQSELVAMPKRLESLTEDVKRQMERHEELQNDLLKLKMKKYF